MDFMVRLRIMENIKRKLDELKEEVKQAIIGLAKTRCEVDMCEFQIRQSFSFYDEEVYHIEKLYIYPEKGIIRVQLIEYADSVLLREFSADDHIGILEEVKKTFTTPKYGYRIDYY